MAGRCVVFGWNIGRRRRICLPLSELTHMHVIGTTGFGKSRLMVALVVQYIRMGVHVWLVDPANQIAPLVMNRLVEYGYFDKNPNAFSDLIYLDLVAGHAQNKYPAFNLIGGSYDPYTTADIVLETVKRVWPALQDGTATNIELMIRLGTYVLAELKLPLLPYLETFLTDLNFRQNLLAKVEDRFIYQWIQHIQMMTRDKKIAEIVQTTLKRAYHLAFPPVLRYTMAQQSNILDVNNLIANRQSVLVNINLTDETVVKWFGSMFMVQAETVARTRGDIPLERKHDKYVVMLDEFHGFIDQSGQSFAHMAAESRRANIFLCVAHQNWRQIPEHIRGALTQMEIVVSFKVKREDALINVDHMEFPIDDNKYTSVFDPSSRIGYRYKEDPPENQRDRQARDIASLPKRHAYIHLPGQPPHMMRAISVDDETDARAVELVKQRYLELYFRDRNDIEAEIDATLVQYGASPIQYQSGTVRESKTPEKPAKQARVPYQPTQEDRDLLAGLLTENGPQATQQTEDTPGEPNEVPPAAAPSVEEEQIDLGKLFGKDDTLIMPEDDNDPY
jgi:hypothetical protein